jgi:hypothetical protein
MLSSKIERRSSLLNDCQKTTTKVQYRSTHKMSHLVLLRNEVDIMHIKE